MMAMLRAGVPPPHAANLMSHCYQMAEKWWGVGLLSPPPPGSQDTSSSQQSSENSPVSHGKDLLSCHLNRSNLKAGLHIQQCCWQYCSKLLFLLSTIFFDFLNVLALNNIASFIAHLKACANRAYMYNGTLFMFLTPCKYTF
jgi:hypothetical protein